VILGQNKKVKNQPF